MIALAKMIPLLVFLGGVAANKDAINDKFKSIMNVTKITATQADLNSIAELVYLEYTDEHYVTVEEFPNFLRTSLRVKKGKVRDVTKDHFGNPFTYERDEEEFTVTSAGVDGEYDTDDDLYSGYEYD